MTMNPSKPSCAYKP